MGNKANGSYATYQTCGRHFLHGSLCGMDFLIPTGEYLRLMAKLPDALSINKEAYRPRTPDEEDVHDLYYRLILSWNQRDAHGFATLFAKQGVAVGFDGSEMPGQKEIKESLTKIFHDHSTGTYVTKVRDMKSVSNDVVMLRAVAGIVPPGAYEIDPSLNAVQTMVAVRAIEGWCIVLYQNTPARLDGRPGAVENMTRELREMI
jgi:uncharacterized protein (TIGR02246 family)